MEIYTHRVFRSKFKRTTILTIFKLDIAIYTKSVVQFDVACPHNLSELQLYYKPLNNFMKSAFPYKNAKASLMCVSTYHSPSANIT